MYDEEVQATFDAGPATVPRRRVSADEVTMAEVLGDAPASPPGPRHPLIAVALSLLAQPLLYASVMGAVAPLSALFALAGLSLLGATAASAHRARRDVQTAPLWAGQAWGLAILSACLPLWAALQPPSAPSWPLIVSLLLGACAGAMCLHAGMALWGRSKAQHDSLTLSASAARGSYARRWVQILMRLIDDYELLLGVSTVLLVVAGLNVLLAVAGHPRTPHAGDTFPTAGEWRLWSALQPTVILTAASAIRASKLLCAAQAHNLMRDWRTWGMATSAVCLAAAGVWDLCTRAVVPAQLQVLPLALALIIGAGLDCRPFAADTPRPSPVNASIASYTILTIGICWLGWASLDYTVGPGDLTSGMTHGSPYMVAAVGLVVLSAATSSARLMLNLRHLTWSLITSRESVTDELTGLLNRRGLLRRLQQASSSGEGLALALIDVDHFKAVNDELGHPAGDELLQQISQRLRAGLQSTSYRSDVARLGGDEFVIIASRPTNGWPARDVVELAPLLHRWGQSLHNLFTTQFTLSGCTVHVSASIGITAIPPTGTHIDGCADRPRDSGSDEMPPPSAGELLRRVDAAMYDAKSRDARGRAVTYDSVRHDPATHRVRITQDLRRALDAGELRPYYQPQVATQSGQPCGVEALLRWEHPARGLVMPADFIPVAEAAGLMTALTDVAIDKALAHAREWQAVSPHLTEDMRVSVNLSASCLLDSQLPARVARMLDQHGLDPRLLVLEITEDVLLREPERSLETITALRSQGISLSIDDFGTGYSSLTQMWRLPVDELKLDRAFTAELCTDPRARWIVKSAVDLAHGLDMRVVAEGVEDDATLTLLSQVGCDTTQGYLHSAPMPADAVLSWLGAHRRQGVLGRRTQQPTTHPLTSQGATA